MSFRRVGCHDTFNNIGDGFGFPVRYKIELSNDPDLRQGNTVVVDHTQADVPNPGVAPQSVTVREKTARYIRFTATRLASRQNDYIFAWRNSWSSRPRARTWRWAR